MAAKNIKWDITSHCNLRCTHCSVANKYFAGEIKELSVEQRISVLDKLIQNGIEGISLLGGEPLLLGDELFKLLEIAKRNEMKISIVTNGILLTNHGMKRLLDLEIDHIVISIEGATQETHEFIRGRNTFNKVINNVRVLSEKVKEKRSTTEICINTVLNRLNISEIEAMVDLCINLGVHEWALLSLVDIGNAAKNKNMLPVTPMQEIKAAYRIAELYQAKRTGDLLISPRFVYPLIWDYIEKKFGLNMPRQKVCCNASISLGYISPDGSLYPCDRIYTENYIGKKIGNAHIRPMSIAEQPFYEIWNSDYYMNFFNFVFKDETYIEYEPCNHCKYLHNRFCNPCPLYSLETKVKIPSCLIAEKELGDIGGNINITEIDERQLLPLNGIKEKTNPYLYDQIRHLIPKQQWGIRSTHKGNYLILLNPYTNEIVAMNMIGNVIWEAINGKNTVEHINTQIIDVLDEFHMQLSARKTEQSLQDQISGRLASFIMSLIECGLISWV